MLSAPLELALAVLEPLSAEEVRVLASLCLDHLNHDPAELATTARDLLAVV